MRMKSLFLLDPSVVFLNHGSFGACPATVFERYQLWQRDLERNPVEFLGRRSAGLLAGSRSALAGYLGTKSENLVYVTNATSGVNTVARSLLFQQGDEILTTDHEYGACDNTWEFVCRHSGARYVHAEIPLPFNAQEFAQRIWSAVNSRTRCIYLSHITSTTALIFPIADLCRKAREKGIITLIDGAHAPGQINLDLDSLGADFYIGNCHKWLCAPKGAAFLFARNEHHHLLDASTVSWGYSKAVSAHCVNDAYTGSMLLERRLQWQGTRDLAAFLTVPDAIDFQRVHDWDAVRQKSHELASLTLERVCELTGLESVCSDADFAQMVVIPLPFMDADSVKERLFNDFRIEIPITTHKDRLFARISIQGYNEPSDCEALIDALSAIFKLSR